jgi:hypothetical protein
LNELVHVHEPRRHEERSHEVACEYNKIMISGTSETKGLLVIAVYHILYCNYQFNMLYITCLVVCLAAIGTDLSNVTWYRVLCSQLHSWFPCHHYLPTILIKIRYSTVLLFCSHHISDTAVGWQKCEMWAS